MSSVIQNLLDSALGDGARSANFQCLIEIKPDSLYGTNGNNIMALTKTSQFPGKTHETIPFKFKGRTIPLKGQVKYDDTWSCTFYLTEDHELKKSLEDWIESLDQKHNIYKVGGKIQKAQRDNAKKGYTSMMKVAQLDFSGATTETMVYTLHNIFPKSVSTVDVDYSAVGTILEFTVEFAYSHFTSEMVISGESPGLLDTVMGVIQEQLDWATDGIGSFVSSSLGSLSTMARRGLPDSMFSPDDMINKVE